MASRLCNDKGNLESKASALQGVGKDHVPQLAAKDSGLNTTSTIGKSVHLARWRCIITYNVISNRGMLIGRSLWEVTHKVSGHTGPISPTSVIVTYPSPRCTAVETLLCRNGLFELTPKNPQVHGDSSSKQKCKLRHGMLCGKLALRGWVEGMNPSEWNVF